MNQKQLKRLLKNKTYINGKYYLQFELNEDKYLVNLTKVNTLLLKYNIITLEDKFIYKYIIPLWKIKKIEINGAYDYDIRNKKQDRITT